MLPEAYRWIVEGFEPEGDPWLMFQAARDLEAANNLEGAASVYDRAFGIDPTLKPIQTARDQLLNRLAVTEHGNRFRYIPAGPFVMGSRDGDPDEQPLHPVWLEAFWMAEVPMSWADYCRLMSWAPPPRAIPEEFTQLQDFNNRAFTLYDCNKIRLQYCEDHTTRAIDWHAHGPPQEDGTPSPFGRPPRTDPAAPWTYTEKPMIAASWHEAVELAGLLSTREVRYALPSEAQWEKAARGGLIGARYPWGDDPPTAERCDFARYHEFSIKQSRSLPGNGYGLHGMSGGVWEWTADWYDREAYKSAADRDPEGPAKGEEKVLRGGSWADCAEAVTNSFRMSRDLGNHEPAWGTNGCPMIGFRLCRMLLSSDQGNPGAPVKPGKP